MNIEDDSTAMVMQFHRAFGQFYSEDPGIHDLNPEGASTLAVLATGLEAMAKAVHEDLKTSGHGGGLVMRAQLMIEELSELLRALSEGDEVACLDALCDMRYVADGTTISLGMGSLFPAAFAEVHWSNMAKLHDGEVVKDAAGRILKPEGWKAPDLGKIIQEEKDARRDRF